MVRTSIRADRDASQSASERRIRFGNYEAGKRGSRRTDLRDPYRLAVALSWPRFICVLILAEVLLNLSFAVLYLLRPGAIANAHPGSLSDAFFFSIETLATVGYGEMFPTGRYGHVVAATELITGTCFIAVVTGVVFVRVSRPRPCFRYPETLVVARHRGQKALMIRVASDRLGILYDAQARLSVLAPAQAGDGRADRTILDLPLIRSDIPVFALSWTLVHVIDAASPLAGLDVSSMTAAGLRLFLMLRAEDAALGVTMRDLRAYQPAQIRFGMRYADALLMSSEGYPVLDLDRLDLLEPDTAESGDQAGQ